MFLIWCGVKLKLTIPDFDVMNLYNCQKGKNMYIKSLEIDNFKSFANDITIPFLSGFTTISGPNGSGKSNIIDSILFALGLSSARTLRVEKLSDYLSSHNPRRNDAFVKVTLCSDDLSYEVSVGRRIKKSSQGYNSIYYLNDKVSTLSDIHIELEKHKITPNSYNVIMQNDVMTITNCSNNERRKIVEEIAGTAEFDRQIEKAENELNVVETRVEQTNIILEELGKTIERLSSEREVAIKYENLRNEKTTLESQVTAVKYFDLKKSSERVHESIIEFGKKKKEKEFELKQLEDNMIILRAKFNEVQEKVRENGEAEQIEVIKKAEEVKSKIQRKIDASNQADVTIHNNEKSIVGWETGNENHKKRIEKDEQAKNTIQEEIKILTEELNRQKAELERILNELSGLSKTAENYIKQRNDSQKELEACRSKEVDIQKQSLPLEHLLENNRKIIKDAAAEIENLTQFKANFKEEKDRLEIQTTELKKELNDYKTIQENSIIEISNIKNELSDKARDIQMATAKVVTLETQKSVSAGFIDRAMDTVLNAKLDGVHNSLMNLGSVDEKYSDALEVAMGGRMKNIVVDDPDVAKIAIEILKSSNAGITTFLPLNKIPKAPNSLRLPKEQGVIDFAVNLVDFDDLYIDAFYLALGETLVVQDYQCAKRLQGKYRMVTLSGELFEKSGAITGGARKKTGLKFAGVNDDEIAKFKAKLKELQQQYSELEQKKDKTEKRQEVIRQNYSNALNTYNQAKIELSNLISKAEDADNRIEILKQSIEKAQPESALAEKKLDEFELEKIKLNEKMLKLQEIIDEIDKKMEQGELRRLKDMTSDTEGNIRELESKIMFKNNEITQQDNDIKFHQQMITDNENRINETRTSIKAIEQDKIKWNEEKILFEQDLEKLQNKISELGEKLKQFQEERDKIQTEIRESEKSKDILVNDLARTGEQIESFKARRREIEPQMEEIIKELKEAGIDCSSLKAPELSTEEIQSKIQSLQKRMTALEPVNMNAIRDYDAQIARKEELDEKIRVLTNERIEINKRMTGYGDAKKETFMQTYNALSVNYKEIFERLADGEGSLYLENQENPFAGGLTMKAKPRGKENKLLSALSGGEKTLAALALVFSIQKYMPAPFYALDEVDANLDGINVEKLADLIKEQSKNTQFIVVSHRKPMVESGDRTVGVTQKDKGITKVTGVARV